MADDTNTPASADESAIDVLMSKGKLARDDSQKPFARDLVTEFVNQVLEQGTVVSKDTVAFINQRILEIDDLIANQLNEIISLGNVSEHLRSSVLNSSYDGLRGYVIETMNSLKARNLKAEESPLYKKLESDLGEFLGFNPDQIAEISPTIRATTVITTHLQLYKLLQELR